MVDVDRVRAHLERLDVLLGLLDAERAAGESAYGSDLRRRLQVERALQLAIQICLDVGAHLVAELGLGPPDDYRDVFLALAEAGVVPSDLGGRLADAAGLRNVLVHGYASLDDHLVYAALADVDDLRAFARAVLAQAD